MFLKCHLYYSVVTRYKQCEVSLCISINCIFQNIQLVGTQMHDVTDIKLVVIAREKSDSVIAGEADVSHRSVYDKSVTVNIPKETFRTRTEVKLQVALNTGTYQIEYIMYAYALLSRLLKLTRA